MKAAPPLSRVARALRHALDLFPDKARENGVVEQAHRRTKSLLLNIKYFCRSANFIVVDHPSGVSAGFARQPGAIAFTMCTGRTVTLWMGVSNGAFSSPYNQMEEYCSCFCIIANVV